LGGLGALKGNVCKIIPSTAVKKRKKRKKKKAHFPKKTKPTKPKKGTPKIFCCLFDPPIEGGGDTHLKRGGRRDTEKEGTTPQQGGGLGASGMESAPRSWGEKTRDKPKELSSQGKRTWACWIGEKRQQKEETRPVTERVDPNGCPCPFLGGKKKSDR